VGHISQRKKPVILTLIQSFVNIGTTGLLYISSWLKTDVPHSQLDLKVIAIKFTYTDLQGLEDITNVNMIAAINSS